MRTSHRSKAQCVRGVGGGEKGGRRRRKRRGEEVKGWLLVGWLSSRNKLMHVCRWMRYHRSVFTFALCHNSMLSWQVFHTNATNYKKGTFSAPFFILIKEEAPPPPPRLSHRWWWRRRRWHFTQKTTTLLHFASFASSSLLSPSKARQHFVEIKRPPGSLGGEKGWDKKHKKNQTTLPSSYRYFLFFIKSYNTFKDSKGYDYVDLSLLRKRQTTKHETLSPITISPAHLCIFRVTLLTSILKETFHQSRSCFQRGGKATSTCFDKTRQITFHMIFVPANHACVKSVGPSTLPKKKVKRPHPLPRLSKIVDTRSEKLFYKRSQSNRIQRSLERSWK